jgi:type IV pilus assembly protein PilX
LPARLPRYLIELMPYARAGEDAGQRTGNFYRITAIGFGTNAHAHVVLQSFYLKAAEERR